MVRAGKGDTLGEPSDVTEQGRVRALPPTFMAYLEAYPEARDELRRRIEERPEYRVWLQDMGGAVLSALDPAGADVSRART